MANSITLAQQFIPILDEVYKQASLTAILDGASDLVRQGANANELIIPKMSMDGLGTYSKASGYPTGDVTLNNETVQCNFDRGRMFSIDNMDNQETANIAFGRLAGEFIRTKVVPELDAFRFAKYASKSGVSAATAVALSAGDTTIKAIRTGLTKMDDNEVPIDGRVLFITPTLYGLIQDLDLTKSKDVLNRFEKVVIVPQTRFYTAIKQNDGTTNETNDDQTAGGYAKASTGKDLNFMIIHKGAVIQFDKHVAPKIISPELNQDADAYKFGYRNVGIADVYANKLAGVYVHASTT